MFCEALVVIVAFKEKRQLCKVHNQPLKYTAWNETWCCREHPITQSDRNGRFQTKPRGMYSTNCFGQIRAGRFQTFIVRVVYLNGTKGSRVEWNALAGTDQLYNGFPNGMSKSQFVE